MALSLLQIQAVLRQAGWPESLIPTMAAVAMGESTGNPDAVNHTSREYSVGLLQINLRAHGTRYGTEGQLRDPLTNARAALAIYRLQGLRAWGAYTDGRYRQWINASNAIYSGSPGASNILVASLSNTTAQQFGIPPGALILGGVFVLVLLLT